MILRLEVFDDDPVPGAGKSETVVLDVNALEEAKLSAYESGYTAGWDDAAAAEADAQNRISADLARSLQGLSFTYHEARTHVVKAIEPLLQEVVDRLLPQIARATLGPVVVETISPIAADLVDVPITLVLNPVARPAVEALLEKTSSLPFTIVDEPTLGEGQVYLRLGEVEREVNLDHALAEISAAVRGFFDLSGKE